MSYIQQNFNQTSLLTLVVTNRLYQIWVWRNMLTLSLLLKESLNTRTPTSNYIAIVLNTMFFKNGITYTYKRINSKNFLIYELNLTKSLKYWNLIAASNACESKLAYDKRFEVANRQVLNQYLLALPVLSIQLSRLYYRRTLFRFFENLFKSYYYPNKHYTNKVFLSVNSSWLFLKYYNSYFFKIYNF